MEGQPTLLITLLAILALMQIEGHRPILPSHSAEPVDDQPVSSARYTGIELELGCALNEMLDGATSSPSAR